MQTDTYKEKDMHTELGLGPWSPTYCTTIKAVKLVIKQVIFDISSETFVAN